MTEIERIAGAAAPGVVAGGAIMKVTPSPPKKVIVAVHGIGDQTMYGTIQAVVNQFCEFFGQPAGVPLGAFHDAEGAYAIGSPHSDPVFSKFGFAEVYWAPIPRGLVDDKHELEKSKAWARTIVERLRLRYEIERGKKKPKLHGDDSTFVEPDRPDFKLLKQVLDELITTLGVLDRLCFLAAKAGLFSFDLRQLLDDYLGDVQVVAEFKPERSKILGAFAATMDGIAKAHSDAGIQDGEIYIVAHSEGTVVSLLALIDAFRRSGDLRPKWANNIKGLMTLGSPIDKHLVLWPDLFGNDPPVVAPPTPIPWHNYYDFGDPVGFELDGCRQWIEDNKWQSVLSFSGANDHGFSRYPLAGKAHTDYWNDSAVFGHFLENVVGEKPQRPSGEKPRWPSREKDPDFKSPPANKPWVRMFSYVVPYLAIFFLLTAASYMLLHATIAAIGSAGNQSMGILAVSIRATGLAALLGGITVAARLPRLTRRWSLRFAAAAAGFAGAWVFSLSAHAVSLTAAPAPGGDPVTLGYALGTVALAGLVSAVRPDWGVKPLLAIGLAATMGRIGSLLWAAVQKDGVGPLWPLLLGLSLFAYMWWLAALMFDLVVVWHVYIRNFQVHQAMERLTAWKVRKKRGSLARQPA